MKTLQKQKQMLIVSLLFLKIKMGVGFEGLAR
jgi:hypothetical protein